MNFLNILATVDKNNPMDVGTGALYAIVAILMVFAILLVIIGITTLVFKLTGLFELKAELDASKKVQNTANNIVTDTKNGPVTISDDDMMAAVLVATIDYRNEIKKDVRVLSVKEVK